MDAERFPIEGLLRDDIMKLLNDVAKEAKRREVEVSLFLVGGAAMALAYSTSRATKDLDGVFEPKSIVYEIAAHVAQRRPEYGLSPDWLNDAAKSFMPGEDADATTLFETVGLSVRIASPRYLFVMKALSAREADEDDLRILYPLCGFASAGEALDTVASGYPGRLLKASTQYLVEGIADNELR
jgi:Nucleotidyltransferase of unknown function (DUF6036)